MAGDLVEQNPVTGTRVTPGRPRTRVLRLAELAAVWRACNDNAYGGIVRLLILTGQRREEIGGLRFDEIFTVNDYEVIVLPERRTKNRRAHLIPLSAQAQTILAARSPVEAILNDFSGRKAGVAGVYNRVTYDKQKRAALVIWAEHVMAAVEGRRATVVPIRA